MHLFYIPLEIKILIKLYNSEHHRLFLHHTLYLNKQNVPLTRKQSDERNIVYYNVSQANLVH